MQFDTFEKIAEEAPKIIKRKLEQLYFLRERPDFHPEESCREHIKIVTERCIQTGDLNLIMTGLLHDIAKLDTVRRNKKTGWPTSPGHDKASALLVRENEEVHSFVKRFGADPEIVAQLCEQHMRIKQMSEMKPTKQQALRDMEVYPLLEVFTRADNMIEEFKID